MFHEPLNWHHRGRFFVVCWCLGGGGCWIANRIFTWARAYPASIHPQTWQRPSDSFLGSMFLYPLQVLLVTLPNTARYSTHTWLLFLTIHYAHWRKKYRVRSGQVTRAGLLTVTPHQKSLQSCQSQIFSRSGFLSSGIHNSASMCNLDSSYFYTCDLSSGQNRDLCITSLWENNEMRPVSSQRVKTT